MIHPQLCSNGKLVRILELVKQEAIDALVGRVADPTYIPPKRVICLDRLFAGNDQLKTNTVLQMKDAEVEFKTF